MKPPWLPTIIILAAMLLATRWVFLVPIFQAPGEDFYADYIFSLYTYGRLIKGDEAPISACSHPWTRYLLQMTNGETVKYRPFAKMSVDYGTKDFFEKLDKAAPDSHLELHTNPLMMAVYPVGYFSLAALWLGLISHINHSISFLFFGARLLSVILLGCSLTFSYLAMRELGLTRGRSTLLLAAISFFPLVSFVGSYIQPDNLTFALISICFFLALRWKNNSLNSPSFVSFKTQNKIIVPLGLTMAGLLLTKYHFFSCAGIAIVMMIVATALYLRTPGKRLVLILVTLLTPSIIVGLVQMWVSWHCQLPAVDSKHWLWHWYTINQAFLKEYDLPMKLSHTWLALQEEYRSLFWQHGSAFASFWGKFGWIDTPLIIISLQITNFLRKIIENLSIAILLCTLVSLVKVFISLLRLAIKHRWRRALYIACSNPIVNSSFLFFIFMFTFNVLVYPSLFAKQGRQWLPMILGIFLTATCFAPRLFPWKILRKQSYVFISAGLLIYSLIGSYFALSCLKQRFYAEEKKKDIDIRELKLSPVNASYSVDHLDYIDPYPSFERHPQHSDFSITVPPNRDVYMAGWAIDFPSGAPATGVLLFLDDCKMYQTAYGLENPLAVYYLKDESYRYSGFGAVIPAKDLVVGLHSLTIKVISKDGQLLYPTNKKLKIIISQ
jgi:hypothetical protein